MLSRHSGHIVNVASLVASFGVGGMAGYCASKYAMLGFSEYKLWLSRPISDQDQKLATYAVIAKQER